MITDDRYREHRFTVAIEDELYGVSFWGTEASAREQLEVWVESEGAEIIGEEDAP